MNEQLLQPKTDSTIYMRGNIPYFTSSTELFTYTRHGVTRCTQQTPGRSLFLILRAFQDTLRKYSQVLSSKFLPQVTPINIASLAGSGAGDNSSASYRNPGGGEVTIFHTDDTCDLTQLKLCRTWLQTDQNEEPWFIMLIHLISSDPK